MNDKTILARLKRSWKSQEKEYVIWNQGILPNFISPNGEYNPISFTCYQLYKILQDSFSYQSIYKYLKKYETEGFLISKHIINKNNRKECIYSFHKRILALGIYKIGYIQNKDEKVKAQILIELIRKYNNPKRIYNDYNKNLLSKSNALNTLQYIIDQGSMFNPYLESSFLLDTLEYFIKISKKDKSLFTYLEEVAVSHECLSLQIKALDYISKHFPDLFNTFLSQKFKKLQSWNIKLETLDDYILTNEGFSMYRTFRGNDKGLKQLKDQKLLDFNIKAKEKLEKYRSYSHELEYGDYNPLTNSLIYRFGQIYVTYNKIKYFEQESYENVLSADLRKKERKFWQIKDRNFYFCLKIFTTVLNIKEGDVFVAFPPFHKDEKGYYFYKSPIKIFSKETDFIIYLESTRYISYN